ncbi:DUF3109 family protein [Luteibaculum oceani]|uniref:DUF3109 family protein n=1 Tax=Luteibaculum oceani TaxID=1294296 RepID=A0A5C6VL83_9FLAO|nr:DUF3109 family protein [Luteibaculum oceani]TXC85136.1 DUF3109 family protein [Luteibaculum oceani]
MIQLGDKLISEEIFDEQFICDLKACKGACCVEGDAGAPVELEEIDKLEENLESVLPYLPEAGQKALKQKGAFEVDVDGEYVTPLVNGKECAYTVFEKNGTAKCGIEMAWKDGKSNFRKPISCHLYPIRVAKIGDNFALNYHRWHICEAACSLGQKEQVPVYKFLKEPLETKFGKAFVDELNDVAAAYENFKSEQQK